MTFEVAINDLDEKVLLSDMLNIQEWIMGPVVTKIMRTKNDLITVILTTNKRLDGKKFLSDEQIDAFKSEIGYVQSVNNISKEIKDRIIAAASIMSAAESDEYIIKHKK